MLRFSLFGFPVAIHWLFWIITAMLGGLLEAKTPDQLKRLVLWIAAALASILIHELGHTFMMRKFGARASIMLYSFGGLAIPDRGFTRGQNILVSLAGPVVEVTLGLLAYFILKAQLQGESYWEVAHVTQLKGVPYTFIFLWNFAFISVFWGLLNLLPIYPLDGGHVINNFLGPSFYKFTMWTGAILATLIGIYSFKLTHSTYNVLIFGMLAWQNVQRATGSQPQSFLQQS